MVSEIKIEFPEFITHVSQSKNKFLKIGYNRIYASAHHHVRANLVGAMHGYIEKHIPPNLTIKTPLATHLKIYVPINYGNVKKLQNKQTKDWYLSWKPPRDGYLPNWDIGNLAMVWMKCLDDVLQKKGIIPDDTIEFIKKSTYEFIEVPRLKDRKLVYELKTMK